MMAENWHRHEGNFSETKNFHFSHPSNERWHGEEHFHITTTFWKWLLHREKCVWKVHYKNLTCSWQKLYEKVIHEIVASIARARFRIVTQPRFREKLFYVKLTTFSTTKETKSVIKPVNDSGSKSKIKVRLPWAVFLVWLMSAAICV